MQCNSYSYWSSKFLSLDSGLFFKMVPMDYITILFLIVSCYLVYQDITCSFCSSPFLDEIQEAPPLSVFNWKIVFQGHISEALLMLLAIGMMIIYRPFQWTDRTHTHTLKIPYMFLWYFKLKFRMRWFFLTCSVSHYYFYSAFWKSYSHRKCYN